MLSRGAILQLGPYGSTQGTIVEEGRYKFQKIQLSDSSSLQLISDPINNKWPRVIARNWIIANSSIKADGMVLSYYCFII